MSGPRSDDPLLLARRTVGQSVTCRSFRRLASTRQCSKPRAPRASASTEDPSTGTYGRRRPSSPSTARAGRFVRHTFSRLTLVVRTRHVGGGVPPTCRPRRAPSHPRWFRRCRARRRVWEQVARVRGDSAARSLSHRRARHRRSPELVLTTSRCFGATGAPCRPRGGRSPSVR